MRVVEERAQQMLEIARSFGLRPLPVRFELAPTSVMQELQAYCLPDRYSHWTFGREYRQTRIVSDFGEKDFEILVNADPVRAWLDESNSLARNTLSIARVLCYADFFGNNLWLAHARRDMPSSAALARKKLEQYRSAHGEHEVETFLDAALTIAELIDPWHPAEPISGRRLPRVTWSPPPEEEPATSSGAEVLVKVRDDVSGGGELGRRAAEPLAERAAPVAPGPGVRDGRGHVEERDIIGFIRDFAPHLADWQRGVLDVVREESLYLWSLRRTSMLSDGWATFWQIKLIEEMGREAALTPDESLRLIIMHSQMLDSEDSLGRFVTVTMLEWASDYYNGKASEGESAWLAEQGLPVYPRHKGDFIGSPGHMRLLQIREQFDDETLVSEFFDKCAHDRVFKVLDELEKEREEEERKQKQGSSWQPGLAQQHLAQEQEEEDPDRWRGVRESLARRVENCGVPHVVVEDGGEGRNGHVHLRLRHVYDGRELEVESLEKTLRYIHTLWGEPVHMETVLKGRSVIFSYDGSELTREVDTGGEPLTLPY